MKIFPVFCAKENGATSFSDVLNFRLTVYLLVFISVLTMARILISEPITCFTPTEFSSQQQAYARQVCWTAKNPYIDDVREENISRKVVPSYHQWFPLIFALQALLFYVPKLFWKLGSSYSGSVNIQQIESTAIRLRSNSENSAAISRYLVHCLGQLLMDHSKRRNLTSISGRVWLLVNINYITWLYLLVKVLCLVNVIVQFALLDVFLSNGNEPMYGFSALRKLRNPEDNESWATSGRLPLKFLCEFSIRALAGNIKRYFTHCSLPMNLWYDVILLFFWFWFVYVAVVTACSLFGFALSQFNIFHQKSYCSLRLIAMGKATASQKVQISRFVGDFMTRDAWFIVQQVSKISGDHEATQLICGLWDTYISQKQGESIEMAYISHKQGDSVEMASN